MRAEQALRQFLALKSLATIAWPSADIYVTRSKVKTALVSCRVHQVRVRGLEMSAFVPQCYVLILRTDLMLQFELL